MRLLDRILSGTTLRGRSALLFTLLIISGFLAAFSLYEYNYSLEKVNSILNIVTSVFLLSATLTTAYIAWKRLEREYEPQVEVENENAKLEDGEWHNLLKIKNKGKTDVHIQNISTCFAIKEEDSFYFIQGHSHLNSKKIDITVDAQSTTHLTLPDHWRAFGCSIIEFNTDYLNDKKAFGGNVAVSPHQLDKFGNMFRSVQYFFDLTRNDEVQWTLVSEDFLGKIIPDNLNPKQKIKQEMIDSYQEKREELDGVGLEPDLVTSEKNIAVEVCRQEIVQERSLIHDFMADVRSNW